MNRKAEKFFDAITLLREDLVEDAQNYVFHKKRAGWKKFASLAACLALIVSLGMLVSVPKGCGASGGGGINNNDSSAPMAPAESPQDGSATTDEPRGDDGPEQGGPVPEPSDQAPSGEAEQLRFFGQVLEVREDGLLVEPFDSFLADLGPIYVSTAGLEGLPEFYEGGTVMVLCGTVSQEGGEAAAEGIIQVDLVEPEAP